MNTPDIPNTLNASKCILQIFIDNTWRDAAVLDLMGDVKLGVDARTCMMYLPDYAINYWGQAAAAAVSVSAPVGIEEYVAQAWPAFLVDLLPQGYGRAELLHQLDVPATAERAADWRLLQAGAGNPIGNIRVKAAHEWIDVRSQQEQVPGFSMDEVAQRAGDFNEYLAQHGLFLAGSSGVQGEWPKILLTQAKDGLFYLDHTLPDYQAACHYIVKFGRSVDPALGEILKLEAPYMELARFLGLHVFASLALRERALFIPRFDRQVNDGKVMRLGQESIASLCGLTGFGKVPSHNEVCRRLAAVTSNPAREIVEYIKRDIANIVLGNKDNHARNTAIQRRHDGTITLTPLFDFAPMWMHPEGIARRIRWEKDDRGAPIWSSVIEQASAASGVDLDYLRAGIKAMQGPLEGLIQYAHELGSLGIGKHIAEHHAKVIENACEQLEAL